ncbi:hypothetical protein MHYP_G00365770, partial [Metynnis hypsauchen]
YVPQPPGPARRIPGSASRTTADPSRNRHGPRTSQHSRIPRKRTSDGTLPVEEHRGGGRLSGSRPLYPGGAIWSAGPRTTRSRLCPAQQRGEVL